MLDECKHTRRASSYGLSSLGCLGEALNAKGGYMKGARYFLRNFTGTAVRKHLRSQIEDSGGSPDLIKNELELVRFICEGSFDWRAFLAAQR
jgi:hypothetical protein